MSEKHYREEIVPYTSGDGHEWNLIHVRDAKHEPTKGPVIMVHGAGVRANIFRAPVETSLVDALIAKGYDVWLENWRASIDFKPNEWTLDQAALYDHPKAVEKVLEQTGADSCKAVIHCQGSTSFTMSAMFGLLPKVDTILTNAVSSHPIIPDWSQFKLKAFLPFLKIFTKYLNPYWGERPEGLFSRLINLMVRLSHHECNNLVCRQVSFTYGSGFPALWRHENINPETHEWLTYEFKEVPLSFFRQIRQSVQEGHLITVEGFPQLPKSVVEKPPQTDARFIFYAGKLNRCFLWESQERAYQYFNNIRPNYHSFHRLDTYGHLDVFMGQNAAVDVFPTMIQELEKKVV